MASGGAQVLRGAVEPLLEEARRQAHHHLHLVTRRELLGRIDQLFEAPLACPGCRYDSSSATM
jgi:hypothetical protein